MTGEYKDPLPSDLANGRSRLDIGAKSLLCIERRDGSLRRSVSLPFTIGLEMNRLPSPGEVKILIRDDDLVGLRLNKSNSSGTARAVAIGFGRLVWYDLLMTAFLDSVGSIHRDAKKVLMVYFDMSDVTFHDIGTSERMWETLEHFRRESQYPNRIEKLSDFLGWLASRDFQITICVDTERAKTDRLHKFLSTLRKLDPETKSIRIYTKSIPEGSMHMKGLLTPVGAIDGSANLTFSGVQRNDESVNHSNVGTSDYRDIATGLRDALHGSKEWNQ